MNRRTALSLILVVVLCVSNIQIILSDEIADNFNGYENIENEASEYETLEYEASDYESSEDETLEDDSSDYEETLADSFVDEEIIELDDWDLVSDDETSDFDAYFDGEFEEETVSENSDINNLGYDIEDGILEELPENEGAEDTDNNNITGQKDNVFDFEESLEEFTEFTEDASKTLGSSELASGQCGTNLTWVLTDDGVFTISGIGAMTTFNSARPVPWSEYKNLIKSIVVEEEITWITGDSFSNCIVLESIELPVSLKHISKNAFTGCEALSDISYAGSEIQWKAVSIEETGNEALLEAKVTCIQESCGGTCGANLTWVLTNDGVLTISGTGATENYYISAIPVPWKDYRNFIEIVRIEEGLTWIRTNTFLNCTSLREVYLPETLINIAKDAFSGCNNITLVEYAGCQAQWSAVSIGDTGNEAITENVTFKKDYISGTWGDELTWTLEDNGILTISGTGEMANGTYGDTPWFSMRNFVRELVITDGVTSITAQDAFVSCQNLENVTITETLTQLGYYTFSGCSSLTEISLPSGLKRVPRYCFNNCTSLTEISLPSGLQRIDQNAFCNCTSLTEISLPVSLKRIESNAFSGCTGLTEVIYPGTPEQWNSMTIEDGNDIFIEEIVFADINSEGTCGESLTWKLDDSGILKISGTGKMYNYSEENLPPWHCYRNSIISAEIDEGVEGLGDYAFYKCKKMNSISLPLSLQEINDYATSECRSLTDVYYVGTQEKWNEISIQHATNEYLDNADFHCHSHVFGDWTIIKAASCTETGLQKHSCSCGETETEVIEKDDHSFGSWIVNKEAACESSGMKTRKCENCNTEETQEIKPTGHVIVTDPEITATCIATGKTAGSHCSRCGKIITAQKTVPVTDHVWDTGVVTKEPTIAETGIKTFTCSKCKTVKTETIPRLTAPDTDLDGQISGGTEGREDETAARKAKEIQDAEAGAEEAVIAAGDSKEAVRSSFARFQVRSTKQTKNSIKLTWNKIAGASAYDIYGSRCGKTYSYQKIARVTDRSYTVKKLADGSKLKKGTYYRFIVVAYGTVNDTYRELAISKAVHVATSSGKVTNPKSITLKSKGKKVKKVTLKKKKAVSLKAEVKNQNKKKLSVHRKVKYESSDPSIAVVNSKGKVKAKKKKGSCTIYAYTQSGVFAKVKITVK